MKTKLLIIASTFMILMNVQAQKHNDSLIIYDFLKGVYLKHSIKPKRGKPVTLQIANINPLFYEITVKSNDREVSYQNLDIELAKRTLDDIQKNNYYKTEENFALQESYIGLWSGEKEAGATKSKDFNQIQDKYSELSKSKITLEKLEKDRKSLNDSLKVDIAEKDSLILSEKQRIAAKEYEIKKIENESKDDNILRLSVSEKKKLVDKAYNEYISYTREIIKLNQNYYNYIDKVISPELTYTMYQSIIENQENNTLYKKCEEDKKRKTSLLTVEEQKKCDTLLSKAFPIETTFFLDREKLKNAYGVVKTYPLLYQDVVAKVNDFVAFVNYGKLSTTKETDLLILKAVATKDIERIQQTIKAADDIVQKINLSKKLNQVEILDRILQKKDTYDYFSAPIQGEEDYLEFNVEIKSKRDLSNTYHINNDKSFRYFEYLTGGIRFDFSIGTTFDFGTVDEKYTLDAQNVIKRVDNNKYNPTIAGIFHASFRNTSDFAWGVSLGASFTTGLSFNSIFPGISLLIGKRNKVIITAGPSLRQVNELKSYYKEGNTLASTLADDDLLTKNFKIGGFVGISYNLTPKQKETLKLK